MDPQTGPRGQVPLHSCAHALFGSRVSDSRWPPPLEQKTQAQPHAATAPQRQYPRIGSKAKRVRADLTATVEVWNIHGFQSSVMNIKFIIEKRRREGTLVHLYVFTETMALEATPPLPLYDLVSSVNAEIISDSGLGRPSGGVAAYALQRPFSSIPVQALLLPRHCAIAW